MSISDFIEEHILVSLVLEIKAPLVTENSKRVLTVD